MDFKLPKAWRERPELIVKALNERERDALRAELETVKVAYAIAAKSGQLNADSNQDLRNQNAALLKALENLVRCNEELGEEITEAMSWRHPDWHGNILAEAKAAIAAAKGW